MFPDWLHTTAWIALTLSGLCALIVAWDVARHPQHMAIMDIVWPVTALFGTVVIVWLYWRYGRLATHEAFRQANAEGRTPPSKQHTPYPIMVAKGALHCGAGCSLGDIAAEWLAFGVPVVATWFGWHSLFDEKIFAVWVLDFVLAFVIGIVFQYFAIVPMRKLSPGKGIVAALKADTLSLSAWQVGMYGVMALVQFAWLRPAYGAIAPVDSPEFWAAMQLAMIGGFVTAYPVNWWLIRAGWKEKM